MEKTRTLDAMQSKPITTAAICRTHRKSYICRFKYAFSPNEIYALLSTQPGCTINGKWEDVFVIQAVDFERGESIVIEFMKKKDYLEACDRGEI